MDLIYTWIRWKYKYMEKTIRKFFKKFQFIVNRFRWSWKIKAVKAKIKIRERGKHTQIHLFRIFERQQLINMLMIILFFIKIECLIDMK